MRIIANQEELKREWVLNRWYEKTVYVFGFIYTMLLLIAFIFGFIQNL